MCCDYDDEDEDYYSPTKNPTAWELFWAEKAELVEAKESDEEGFEFMFNVDGDIDVLAFLLLDEDIQQRLLC